MNTQPNKKSYRELQAALKKYDKDHRYHVRCKLTAKYEVLQAELERLEKKEEEYFWELEKKKEEEHLSLLLKEYEGLGEKPDLNRKYITHRDRVYDRNHWTDDEKKWERLIETKTYNYYWGVRILRCAEHRFYSKCLFTRIEVTEDLAVLAREHGLNFEEDIAPRIDAMELVESHRCSVLKKEYEEKRKRRKS